MREAHARNPGLRRAPEGKKKRCGHCGEEGHNRRACPQRLAEAQAQAEAKSAAAAEVRAEQLSRLIVIEEVDDAAAELASPAAAAAAASAEADVAAPAPAAAAPVPAAAAGAAAAAGSLAAEGEPGVLAPPPPPPGVPAAPAPAPVVAEGLQVRQLAPGMTVTEDGSWVFPLPQSKEECVVQAAQVRAAQAPRLQGSAA